MIALDGLTKRYGALAAVRDLSFHVDAGEILGLLGPNGAGKTTTLEMLMGLVLPSAGTACVGGVDVVADPEGVKRVAGYLPETPRLFAHLSGWTYLDLVAEAHGLDQPGARERASAMLERLDLVEPAGRAMGGYSYGERRKIALVAAMLHRPRVLLLDEPHAGLDPAGSLALEQLVQDAIRDGLAAVVSTHQIEAVHRLCRRIGILHHGQMVSLGTPDELIRLHGEGAPDSTSSTLSPSHRQPLEAIFRRLLQDRRS